MTFVKRCSIRIPDDNMKEIVQKFGILIIQVYFPPRTNHQVSIYSFGEVPFSQVEQVYSGYPWYHTKNRFQLNLLLTIRH